MADPVQVIQRGRQLLDLLTDSRFREYQQRHGDPAALQRQIGSALERAAAAVSPDAPDWLPPLRYCVFFLYVEAERDPHLIFDRAAEGKIREAVERLDLFQAEPEWRTLARLLIAWARATRRPTEESDAPARPAPSPPVFRRSPISRLGFQTGAGPTSAPARLAQMEAAASECPDLPSYIAALLQRAGENRTPQGYEQIVPACSRPG